MLCFDKLTLCHAVIYSTCISVRPGDLGLIKVSRNSLISFFLQHFCLVVFDLSEANPKMQLNVGVSLGMTREKGQVWPAADLG